MSEDAIAEFWAWWPRARTAIEAAIGGGGFDETLVADIAAHVDAIRDGLDWELMPGHVAQHAFCLSAKGDSEGRLVTEMWRHRGPPADGTWEYHAARQGNRARAGMTIEIGGFELDPSDLLIGFEIDRGRERIDGTYHHPAFADMPEELRTTVTFLILDGMLGEDGVERWLGTIDSAVEPPAEARPIAELEAAVEQLATEATGEQFAVLRGEDDGGAPIFVTINQALKRIDHLLACMHVVIELAIHEPDERGLPADGEAEALNAIEDELGDALAGSDAVYYGRETRRGRRVLHWFAPEDGPANAAIQRWSASHPDREINTTWTRDPRWEVQRRFT